jgi:integrase
MDKIDTKGAREKLPARGRAYFLNTVASGITLGYRRLPAGPGSWLIRKADGKGGAVLVTFAKADDLVPADGKTILDFDQALLRAREVAVDLMSDVGPLSIDRALTDFANDLAGRDSNPDNARRVRKHLSSTMLAKPVGALTARELKRWRDDLLKKMTRPTAVRTIKMFRAALNLAADLDSKITNRNDWRIGLKTRDDYRPVDRVLEDDQVLQLIDAAYAFDYQYGLLLEVLAFTGTRTKQATRLMVSDLDIADKDKPRLMMPVSRKGKYRKTEVNRSIPIPVDLAGRLRAAAGTRPRNTALLVDGKGNPWKPAGNEIRRMWKRVAEQGGIKETMYALRHSFITRSLKAGIPPSVLANSVDTSVAMIEKTYGRFVANHADDIMRRALLPSSKRILRIVP